MKKIIGVIGVFVLALTATYSGMNTANAMVYNVQIQGPNGSTTVCTTSTSSCTYNVEGIWFTASNEKVTSSPIVPIKDPVT